jgi:succinoglycan biosynthesis transport protein ExoP
MSAVIVAGVVLLSAGVGFLVQPRHQAKATIALASPPAKSVLAPGVQGDASLARYTAQRAAFITSDEVLRAVAASLKRKDITALRHDISASPSKTANTVVVTAEADSDGEAVKLAAATVAAYRSETEQQVKRLTAAAIRSIEESAARAEDATATSGGSSTVTQFAIAASDIRVSSALFGDGVDFVVAPRADAVIRPTIPRREIALGFVLGLVLAATAAWMRADARCADRFVQWRPWTVQTRVDKAIELYFTPPRKSLPGRGR